MTDPLCSEMQAVRPRQPDPKSWQEGIIVDRRWEEAGQHWRTGDPSGARWIYEVQID